ncbi:rhomboid family intramembrane serine protease [Fulvitalea axinellae]|uniref:Rhomboid family intramembrane serine protease n=1 Tax=Fulvitalea axinellae TaxID=1182444 RepID=A0AAU9CKQ7_9BACT|nr:rhomboid family intramembrane serine protease [Fulvitalea axinellae]
MFNNLTPIVKNLLLINVAVFALINLLPSGGALVNWLELHYTFSPGFKPYQFFTYMFTHASFMHLFSNMFGLFMFGPWLEKIWGPKRFLFFYIATGVGAGLLYSGVSYFSIRPMQEAAETFLMNPNPEAFNAFISKFTPDRVYRGLHEFIQQYAGNPESESAIMQAKSYVHELVSYKVNTGTIGASGAIFGILLAFGMLFPETKLMLLIPPIPIKAKYFVLFYGAYELYAGFRANPDDNVAHFAHLSGMLIAYLILRYWRKQNGTYY